MNTGLVKHEQRIAPTIIIPVHVHQNNTFDRGLNIAPLGMSLAESNFLV